MTRVVTVALDRAAELIAAVLGAAVAREPLGAQTPESGPGEDVGLVVALSEGEGQELGYLISSATPFEFQHGATLEIIAAGGSEDERRARRDAALATASAAIADDPTLGGLVDWAELERADLSVEERFAAVTATLTLTYSAPTALG